MDMKISLSSCHQTEFYDSLSKSFIKKVSGKV